MISLLFILLAELAPGLGPVGWLASAAARRSVVASPLLFMRPRAPAWSSAPATAATAIGVAPGTPPQASAVPVAPPAPPMRHP